jgi:hypothetical protein
MRHQSTAETGGRFPPSAALGSLAGVTPERPNGDRGPDALAGTRTPVDVAGRRPVLRNCISESPEVSSGNPLGGSHVRASGISTLRRSRRPARARRPDRRAWSRLR